MTRMWCGVTPRELCDDHLLGEHSEMHLEVGTWKRHPHGEAVVEGHTAEAQVLPHGIRHRHRRLAAELERRGFDHDSPLEDFDPSEMPGSDDDAREDLVAANRHRLAERCRECGYGMAEARVLE